MWATIHPDGPFLLVRPHVHPDSDELLRVLVVFLPDAELIRTEKHIGERVGRALMLEHRVPRHVPAVGEEARRLVQRDPAEVAGLLTWNTVRLVFVIAPTPLANEVDLRM